MESVTKDRQQILESMQGYATLPLHYKESLKVVAACMPDIDMGGEQYPSFHQMKLGLMYDKPGAELFGQIARSSDAYGIVPLLNDPQVRAELSVKSTTADIQRDFSTIGGLFNSLGNSTTRTTPAQRKLMTLYGLSMAHVLYHLSDPTNRQAVRGIIIDLVPQQYEKFFNAGTTRINAVEMNEQAAYGFIDGALHTYRWKTTMDTSTPANEKLGRMYTDAHFRSLTLTEAYQTLYDNLTILGLTKAGNPKIEQDLLRRVGLEYAFNQTAWQSYKDLYLNALQSYLGKPTIGDKFMQEMIAVNHIVWKLDYFFENFFVKPKQPQIKSESQVTVQEKKNQPQKRMTKEELLAYREPQRGLRIQALSKNLGIHASDTVLDNLVEIVRNTVTVRSSTNGPRTIPVEAEKLGYMFAALGIAKQELWTEPQPGEEYFLIEVVNKGIKRDVRVPIEEWRKTSRQFSSKFLTHASTVGSVSANPRFDKMTLVFNALKDYCDGVPHITQPA